MNYEVNNALKRWINEAINRVGNANKLAKISKVSRRSIGIWKNGKGNPTRDKLNAISIASKIPMEWLDTDDWPTGENTVSPSIIKEDQIQYGLENRIEDQNLFGKSVSYLKEIFDSKDHIFISAIIANLHTFSRSIRREKESLKLTNKIEKLENNINTLREVLRGYIQPRKDGPERRKHILQLLELEDEPIKDAISTKGT